ncbi:MAG: helix-turn-helix domain-containing protein [Dysgonomonas sp.]
MKRFFTYIFIYFIAILSIDAQEQENIFIEGSGAVRHFSSDSVFINYAQKGFLYVIDDLYDYYEDIVPYLPLDFQKKEILKMRQIAQDNASMALDREADYLQALVLPENSKKRVDIKVDEMQRIANIASEEGDVVLKMRSMEAIFDVLWRKMRYAQALRQAHIIDKELQKISYEEYPGKGNAYFLIGKAFYFFKDYNTALPYLHKAVRPAEYYFDRSNLEAKNAIGKYYNLIGKVDSAEYYFRSAYFTPEHVKSKSLFDAIALSNIGQSLILKHEYDSAIPYLNAGMGRMLLDDHYELAAETTIGLANCYLAKNKLKRVKVLIDSAQYFIGKSGNDDLYQSFYPLMCKYYAKKNNAAILALYSDSTILFNDKQAQKYNGIYLLRAEQELFELEKQVRADELKFKEENYKSKQRYFFIVISIISIAMVILIILYREKKNAYRALVQKNQDWAQGSPSYTSFEAERKPNVEVYIDQDKVLENVTEEAIEEVSEEKVVEDPSEEDRTVMKKVYEVVIKEKVFKDLDLTLDSLAKSMDINRNYLSKAINKTTGKNFNTYINEHRVKEAIKMLSSEKSDIISIDAIALEVGFNNRTSFYQSFKKITGLSPSDFRNNRVK